MAMTNECGHDLTLIHQENMKISFATGLSHNLLSVSKLFSLYMIALKKHAVENSTLEVQS